VGFGGDGLGDAKEGHGHAVALGDIAIFPSCLEANTSTAMLVDTREAAAVISPPPQAEIQSVGSGCLLLTCPGAAFRTYQVEASTHLSQWELLHATSMEGNSTIALPLLRDGERTFFRLGRKPGS